MPIFELQHPDGRTFEVEAPDQQSASKALGVLPKGKPVSQLGAFIEGAKSGLTAGFVDELTGAFAASGLPKLFREMPASVRSSMLNAMVGPTTAFAGPAAVGGGIATGLARMGYEQVTGQNDPTLSGLVIGEQPKGEATKAYEEARDASRAEQKAAQEQYPKTFIAGDVAGSLAMPGGAAARTATLPVRMLRGAATAAGYGAAKGVGEGETPAERATGGAVGGVVGGAVGAVAPPVAAAVAPVIERGVRAVATSPLGNALRGMARPDAEAARQVTTAIERDIRSDPTATRRLTPQEFAAARSEGQPVGLMDVGGDLTRRLADVSGMTSPEARTTLDLAINPRFEQQSPRLAQWLRQTFHYPDAAAQQEAIDRAATNVNRQAYDALYRHPSAQGLWDEGFEQISQAPEVQTAIRKVLPKSASQAAREGFTPLRNPFTLDTQSGRMVLRPLSEAEARRYGAAPGTLARPNLEFWDRVKRELDRGDWSSREWSRVLRGHIDDLVPQYAQVRQGAAHFFGAENALEAGQNFVGAAGRYGIPEARRQLARMSPQERQLFQDGYVSRLIEQVEKTGDRRSVLNNINQSAAAREEMRIAIGPQRAAELEGRLRVEGIMELARAAVQGNSWTARRLYDMGLAGGAGLGLHGYDINNPQEFTIGALVAALSAGGKRANRQVMQRVARLLVSDDPVQLAQGVRIIARNQRLLDGLRTADLRLGRTGGQEAGQLPALQSAGTGRADEDKKNVPRPPGQ